MSSVQMSMAETCLGWCTGARPWCAVDDALLSAGLYDDGSYDLLVNEMLVRMGYATVYDGELDKSERYKSRLKTAELVAETEGIGGWSGVQTFRMSFTS